MNSTPHQEQLADLHDADQTVGGAVIDAEGREVPITEHMVRQACQALEPETPDKA